jgi:hypothetical protein
MPFTLSHPAAVVPFARSRLVLSALVIGSMTPDFPYFFCLSTRYHFGHTLPGLFLFCLPAGLVALWLFHRILKRPLLSLLPVTHQQGLIPFANEFRFAPWPRVLLIVLSLLIGAFTHIAWDSLTHRNGWMVQQIPVLSKPLLETTQGTLKVYKVLQHGSTLFGAVVLFFWYLKWLKQAPRPMITTVVQWSPNTKKLIIVLIGASACLLATFYSLLTLSPVANGHSFYQFIVNNTIVSISIIFLELIIFSAVYFATELTK